MKIALCLYGLQGNLEDKSGSGLKDSNILKISHNYWYEYFLSRYDVDVYIHSWEPELEDKLIELYNPIKYKFEKQKVFEIPKHIEGTHTRKQNHYSRWYSQFQCNKLRKKSNIKYDYIMMSRFDMAWSKYIEFEKLKTGVLYYPGDYLQMNHRHKMQDLFHISQDKIMNKFCNLYNKIGEYASRSSKYCNNQRVGISSHRISKFHVRSEDIKHETLLYRRANKESQSDYTIIRLLHELKDNNDD